MTVVADIIEEAFREASLITELEHPTPTQTSRALTRLQSIVSAAYGFEVGELLQDWNCGAYPLYFDGDQADYWQYPVINSRILAKLDSPRTIYFPVAPSNGSLMKVIDVNKNLATYNLTIDGNGRNIEGGSQIVLNTNGVDITWIYDAETANWGRKEGITLDSEMPFPFEFDDYFITSLAVALSPRYSAELTTATGKRLNDSLTKIRSRYRQSQQMPSELGLLRLPSDWRYYYGYSFGPWMFDRGYPTW